MLTETFAEDDGSPIAILAGEELTRLEDVVKKLHSMHLQLLVPEAQRFKTTAAKNEDKSHENKPATTGATSSGFFQPAGLPQASSSVPIPTPMDLNF